MGAFPTVVVESVWSLCTSIPRTSDGAQNLGCNGSPGRQEQLNALSQGDGQGPESPDGSDQPHPVPPSTPPPQKLQFRFWPLHLSCANGVVISHPCLCHLFLGG